MKRYYLGVDYYIIKCAFPTAAVYGTVAANTNGTVNIYINSLCSEDRQRRALEHELRHLVSGHLWDDAKPLTEKEDEADADDSLIRFGKDYSYVEKLDKVVPLFDSLEALMHYVEKTQGIRFTRDTL